ncbi:MAG: Type 1 glutamine amidotransferase-like domain-containing protein [Anaerolineales bacterium]|nr:Type 1 glutamine amidotransferase-like domain-containing protein [Anaerolineales bacterium]
METLVNGRLLLEGGAEFGGQMSEPDLRAIELAGGLTTPICILPTAAALDNNHQRAGRRGLDWFSRLGAASVSVVSLIDRPSANDPEIAAALRSAKLIYLLGGFPGYLAETLSGSRGWRAALAAYQEGAVLGGSSAGAMVLCQHLYDPYGKNILPGLNLAPNACLLPHHNTFGRGWAARLQKQLPGTALIGIDEETGMLDDGPQGAWKVYGAGTVTLYREGTITIYHPGETFSLSCVLPGNKKEE